MTDPATLHTGRGRQAGPSGLPPQQIALLTRGVDSLTIQDEQLSRNDFTRQQTVVDRNAFTSSSSRQQIASEGGSRETLIQRSRSTQDQGARPAGGLGNPTSRGIQAPPSRSTQQIARPDGRVGASTDARTPLNGAIQQQGAPLPRAERTSTESVSQRAVNFGNSFFQLTTELTLSSKHPVGSRQFREASARHIAQYHDEEVPINYPRMVGTPWPETYDEGVSWGISQVRDPLGRLENQASPSPPRFELVSPFLHVFDKFRNPSLRPYWETVFEVTWRYLNEHYIIQGHGNSRTRIHIWRPGLPYTISEMKRLFSAAIHFEQAFSVTMTRTEYDDSSASSGCTHTGPRKNWRDNADLRNTYPTPAAAIAAIDAIPPHPSNIEQLTRLVQPASHPFKYCWMMEVTLHRWTECRPISYCQQSLACRTAPEAIRWTDLVLAFVGAALACPPAKLALLPHGPKNAATLQGLARFMKMDELMLLGGGKLPDDPMMR